MKPPLRKVARFETRGPFRDRIAVLECGHEIRAGRACWAKRCPECGPDIVVTATPEAGKGAKP